MVKQLLHIEFDQTIFKAIACCFKQNTNHTMVCLILRRFEFLKAEPQLLALITHNFIKLAHTGLEPTISASGACRSSRCAAGKTFFSHRCQSSIVQQVWQLKMKICKCSVCYFQMRSFSKRQCLEQKQLSGHSTSCSLGMCQTGFETTTWMVQGSRHMELQITSLSWHRLTRLPRRAFSVRMSTHTHKKNVIF